MKYIHHPRVSFMRKALTTATVFFFAGKTAEGVGKTPGSCSKTQDFQFTTPSNVAKLCSVEGFRWFLWFESFIDVKCLGCVLLEKLTNFTFIASQKLPKTWWDIWIPKTYPNNAFSAGIWKTSKARNMRLSNWESCPCYRGDTFKQSLKPRKRSECTWRDGW